MMENILFLFIFQFFHFFPLFFINNLVPIKGCINHYTRNGAKKI